MLQQRMYQSPGVARSNQKSDGMMEDVDDFLAIQPGGSDTSMQVHGTSCSTCDHQARPDANDQRLTHGTGGSNLHLAHAHTSRSLT